VVEMVNERGEALGKFMESEICLKLSNRKLDHTHKFNHEVSHLVPNTFQHGYYTKSHLMGSNRWK